MANSNQTEAMLAFVAVEGLSQMAEDEELVDALLECLDKLWLLMPQKERDELNDRKRMKFIAC